MLTFYRLQDGTWMTLSSLQDPGELESEDQLQVN